MSFNRLPSLEAQPPEYRDEPETQADPEFDKFSEDLSTKVSPPIYSILGQRKKKKWEFADLSLAIFPHCEYRSIVATGELARY